MKTLLIAAQDIKKITLAWLDNGVLQHQKDVSVEPDNYLRVLDEFLQAIGQEVSDVGAVGVITGPGSFTASRVSVTLANAIAWARLVKIAALENPRQQSWEPMLVDYDNWPWQDPPAAPTYDRPPNITRPKPS